jgi:transcriptional regulator with XRE-family HTH domain
MTLGEKIQQLRKTQGLSQEALAEKLTVSRQAISKWELGESMPDTENVVSLSKLFDVSTDYLLRDEFASEGDKDLRAAYRGRTDHTMKIVALWGFGVGALGLFVLLLLSSILYADKTIADPTIISQPVKIDLATGEELAPIDSEMTMWTTIRVRGDLPAFLSTYHLEWLLCLCATAMIVAVVVFFIIRRRTRLTKRT